MTVSVHPDVAGTVLQDLLTNTSTANTVGTHLSATAVISAQQGSNIGYLTAGYASSGATGMHYSVQVRLESLS